MPTENKSKSITKTDIENAELTRSDSAFDDADLASVGSFSDAMELLSASGLIAEDFASSYGTGFTVLDTKDKARLVGVDFMILEWAFNTGENGEFVSAAIVTEPGEKLILNDGSTGIRDQLRTVTATRLARGVPHADAYKALLVKGLRESTYPTLDGKPLTKGQIADGVKPDGRGTTFYLNN